MFYKVLHGLAPSQPLRSNNSCVYALNCSCPCLSTLTHFYMRVLVLAVSSGWLVEFGSLAASHSTVDIVQWARTKLADRSLKITNDLIYMFKIWDHQPGNIWILFYLNFVGIPESHLLSLPRLFTVTLFIFTVDFYSMVKFLVSSVILSS